MRRRALFIAIGFFAIAAVAVVVVLGSIEVDRYRPEIARQLSQTLGREVQIRGPLALHLGFAPRIDVADVTLANARGQSPPEMAKIGELGLELDLWRLMRREIALRDLRVRDAEILLQWDQRGRPNWPSPGSTEQDDSGDSGLRFDLENITAENLTLRFHRVSSGSRRTARIEHLTLKREMGADEVEVAAAGEIEQVPFELSGTSGTIADFLSGESAFPIDVEGKILSSDVEISGRVEGNREQVKVSGVRVRLDETQITGEFHGSFPSGGRPSLIARLTSPSIHLDDVGLAQPDQGKVDVPRATAAPPEGPALPFEHLQRLDADVSLQADRVVGRGDFLIEQMDLPLKLEGGDLVLGPVELAFEGGSFTANARVDASVDPPALSLDLQGTEMHLGTALAQLQENPAVTGIADLSLKLGSRGASARALRAALEGNASLAIREGEIHVKNIDYVAQNLLRDLVRGTRQVLARTTRTILGDGTPDAKNATDAKAIQCLVADFEIEDGVATARVLALDTGKIVMLGEGQVDLVRERYDLTVNPKVKQQGLLAVTIPLDISGPLNDPKVSPNPVGATRSTATDLLRNLVRASRILPFVGADLWHRESCADLREELSR
jgi:uncharacterized protein involved in outer membrane biogenesis